MNGHDPELSLDKDKASTSASDEVLEWSWEAEHADREREAKADAALHGAPPFQVDRKVLKDVVREKTGVEVGRIKFLSSGRCLTCDYAIMSDPHLSYAQEHSIR